ncbi:MAG: cupin domain-containing protein [Tissierellia bacterium]|nr:cupin domain-containing protein [Tissierellia bacterium]
MINFFENTKFLPSDEEIKIVFENDEIRIERICSNNCPSGPYFQDNDEWVMILDGEAILEMNGENIDLSKGDSIFIPRKTVHSVLGTSKNCIWIAIHIKVKK